MLSKSMCFDLAMSIFSTKQYGILNNGATLTKGDADT